MAFPERCSVCDGTLANPCKHFLGNPRRLVEMLHLALEKLAENEILWDGRQFSFSPSNPRFSK